MPSLPLTTFKLSSRGGRFLISNQLPHRLVIVVHEELRAPSEVVDRRLVHVDPDVVVERGEDFLKMHRTLGRFATEAIGRADDLARFHPAASENAHETRGQ